MPLISNNIRNRKFGFRCHRNRDDIYAVNSIAFHPVHGTFGTAGSDGSVAFWDKDTKQRISDGFIPKQDAPITATAFNSTGSIYAYAVSYDWSKVFFFVGVRVCVWVCGCVRFADLGGRGLFSFAPSIGIRGGTQEPQ